MKKNCTNSHSFFVAVGVIFFTAPLCCKGAVKKNCTNSHKKRKGGLSFFVAVGAIFFTAPLCCVLSKRVFLWRQQPLIPTRKKGSKITKRRKEEEIGKDDRGLPT